MGIGKLGDVAPTFDEVNKNTAALRFGRAMSYFFADPSSRERKLVAWWGLGKRCC